jgi:transposase-like protein
MKSARRAYSPEIKNRVLELSRYGWTSREIARDTGVSQSTVKRWIRQAKESHAKPAPQAATIPANIENFSTNLMKLIDDYKALKTENERLKAQVKSWEKIAGALNEGLDSVIRGR